MENEKKVRHVFSPAVARKLLRDGYRVVDIKPSRTDPRRTIFLFEVEPGFLDALQRYTERNINEFKPVDMSAFGLEFGIRL